MIDRLNRFILATGVATLMLTSFGCSATMSVRESRRTPVDDGAGSLEETRRSLEGSWTLVSLEVVDPSGNRRPVKASGQLTYATPLAT